MPRVPTVQGPSVEAAAAPNVRQSADAPLGAFTGNAQAMQQAGQGVMQLGAALGRIQDAKQEREDADLLMRADTTLKSEWLEQQRVLRNRAGQDAWGAAEDTKKWFDEAIKRSEGGLTNERQRFLFRKQAEALRLQGLEYAGRHEDEQRKRSVIESSNARIVADTNLAAADPSEQNIAKSRRSIEASVEAVGRLNGWSPEQIAVAKQEKTGQLHKQVLQGLIENDPLKAEQYLAAHKAEIPGDDHAEIDKAVRLGTTKVKAQAFTDEALRRGIPEADAIRLVREKYQGDEEDTFATIIKGRYSEVEAAKNRAQAQAADSAWEIVERGGGLGNIPTSTLQAMDPRSRLSLKNHLKAEAERRTGRGEGTKTDWATYGTLRQMAADQPEKFKQLDLVQYFDKLAPGQREQLLDLRQSLAKGAKDEKHQEVATLSQQLSNAHDLLKITGNDNAEKRGKFDSAVMSAVSQAQRQKGKSLTYEERQAVIDRMAIEGTVKGSGWLWDDKKRAYEVVGTADAAKFSPTVPDGDRQQIEAALKAKGKKVTDAEVLRLYKQVKGLQ